MKSVVYATEPYGKYLQSYYRTEVVLPSAQLPFKTQSARYVTEGQQSKVVERQEDEGEYPTLAAAIEAAESHRKDYLNCAAEEMAGAADEVRARDWAYETQQVDSYPENFEPFLVEPSGINTRIEYLYRDGQNFKHYDSIVVSGLLSEHEQQELRDALSSERFIPEQVGMRPLQEEVRAYGSGEDDAWHEIESIASTEEPTTFPGTARDLLVKFKATDWDPTVSEFEQSSPGIGSM